MLRILLVVIFAGLATAAMAEKRFALVFADDDYAFLRPLRNAVNDARAIEATLKRLDFEVTVETNRNLRRMRRALDDFREDAEGADVAMVFYSGHGVELSGENRLLPVDADPSSLARLKETSLPLDEVRETVAAVARIGLIVLDACRNDPFGQEGLGEGRGAVALQPDVAAAARPGLGRMGRAENILFAFSAAPGQSASDGAGANSEFTAALAKFLPTDGLEIRSVLTLVQQEVYDFSRARQLPYIESGLPRLFFASATGGDISERDRLLLAMADITPDLRSEVEAIAAGADMPLAPLYAALISSDGKAMADGERRGKLQDAARAFVQVRSDLRNLGSSDPRVTALRQDAEAQLALGAFDEARAHLSRAAAIDGESREDLKANFIERTLSEATSHYLNGGAARAELRYGLAIEDFGKAVALYAEIDGFDLPDEARYQQVLSLELIGTMQMTVGNLTAAGVAYGAMEKAARKRASLNPDHVDVQRGLVVAQNKVAEVMMATGDLAGAIAIVEQSRAVLTALIDKEPRLEYLRDLGVSFNRTGDARRMSGDGPGAVEDYRAGLKIAEFLVAQVPDDGEFRRDLGISHSKLGLALRLTNDLVASLAAYDTALAISEALASESPGNLELQRDLTVGLNAIGDLRRLKGDNAGARAPYERSVAISRQLIERDPTNTLWRRDLSLGLTKLGDQKGQGGDLNGALEDYSSALALSEYLADLDPANAEWQRDLAVSLNRVGDILLAQGDGAGAAQRYRDGLVIAEAQLAADPRNVQRTVDAAFSRYKLGTAGVNPVENFAAALDMLTRLKEQGRLPGANEAWISMVENALAKSATP